jgi:uncharacterized membrane protein
MIVLAYLWPLALVPLLLDRQDADVQWHARNGIVLMVAELVILLLMTVVASVVSVAMLGIGWMISVVGVMLWLVIVTVQIGILALHGWAIFRGINGARLIVPGISWAVDRF